MKTLNLENLGVQEMEVKEMKVVDGGILLGPLNLFKAIREGVGTLAGWAADAAHGVVDGFNQGAK